MSSVKVFPTPREVALYAAKCLREALSSHSDPAPFRIALSGGNTPREMYAEFVQIANAGKLCREKAEFFFSDERPVGPESEQSNYRTAYQGLIQPLGIPGSIVHRMRGEADDLAAEARRYEAEIRDAFACPAPQIPSFDLILLGMGPDGHTASLFPDFDFTARNGALVAAPFVRSLESSRLTFTLGLINKARKVLFLVTGSEKGPAVTNVLAGGITDDILPAGRVDAHETIWLLDQKAAAQLDRRVIDEIRTEC